MCKKVQIAYGRERKAYRNSLTLKKQNYNKLKIKSLGNAVNKPKQFQEVIRRYRRREYVEGKVKEENWVKNFQTLLNQGVMDMDSQDNPCESISNEMQQNVQPMDNQITKEEAKKIISEKGVKQLVQKVLIKC